MLKLVLTGDVKVIKGFAGGKTKFALTVLVNIVWTTAVSKSNAIKRITAFSLLFNSRTLKYVILILFYKSFFVKVS